MEGRNDGYKIGTESCGLGGRRASDRCGRGLRQGSVWKVDTGRTRVWQQWSRVKTKKNEGDLGLKQGNVATFRATSRRFRDDIFQRRDVGTNVATFQRVKCSNVATFDPTSRRSREC